MRLEELGRFKNAIISLGIEPETFRIVAQCLNQLSYRIKDYEQALKIQRYKGHDYYDDKLLTASLLFGMQPLWCSGQSYWLQIQRTRVRFREQPDLLRSSGSGTGSSQPRVYN
jgi:hypothetical protein